MILPVLVIAGLIGFFVGLIVLVRWLGRAVHRSIEGYATQAGLTYTDDKLFPACEGRIEGRHVRVANEIIPVPWGRKSRPVPMFVVEVGIDGAPPRMWLGKAPLHGSAQPPRQQISVLTVDEFAYVVTETPEEARVWLSRERAQALKALVDAFTRRGAIEVDNVFVEEGKVVLRMTHMKKAKAAWIAEVVDGLTVHAKALSA